MFAATCACVMLKSHSKTLKLLVFNDSNQWESFKKKV